MQSSRIFESNIFNTIILLATSLVPWLGGIAQDEFPPTVSQEFGLSREITGQITARAGEGVLLPASVRVFVIRERLYQSQYVNRVAEDPGVLCNASGQYKVQLQDRESLLFVSSGFAPRWKSPPDGNTLDVQLSKGRAISGTVVGVGGEPIQDAEIKLTHWLIPRDTKDRKEWGKEYGGDRNILANLPDFGESTKATTDSSGRFELKNVPVEFRATLSISAAGLLTRSVVVRAQKDGSFDQRAADFPGQELVEGDFEIRMVKSSVLQVTGLDDETGQPAKIRAISIQPISKYASSELDRLFEINDFTGSINLLPFRKGFEAWVEPVDSDRLMGCRLSFPPNSKGQLIESDVRFKTGKTLRGIVKDEQTDEPIPNVPLRWLTQDMKRFDAEGNFAPITMITDEAGMFEAAVPNRDGIFGIAGNVSGYQSDFGWNRQKEYETFAPDLLERFTRKISAGDEEEPPFEFWLRPSYQLKVSTVSSEGAPIADCTVFAKTYEHGVFRTSARNKVVSETTDSDGKAVFPHWYHNAYQLDRARAAANGEPDNVGQTRRSGLQPPNRLTAFSEGGVLQGSTSVPFPDPDSETNEVEVTIVLKTTGSVTGSVVGVDKEPVKGIWIQAYTSSTNVSFGTGLGWWTNTRDDGRFLIENIPVDVPLKWRVDATRTKTRERAGRITVDTSQLQSGKILEVPPIVVMDLSSLSQPLADIDLEGLGNEEALQDLERYASEHLAKVPEDFDFKGKSFRGSSRQDADSVYVLKLAKKLEALVFELADRDPGGQYEMKVLAAASPWFHDSRNNGGAIGYANSFNHALYARLMDNHVENELAQEALLRYTVEVSRLEFEDRGKRWRELRKKSPFKKTKAIASVQLLFTDAPAAMRYCNSKFSDQQFETQFSKLKEGVTVITESLSELDNRTKQLLDFPIRDVNRQIKFHSKKATEDSAMTPARLEKIAELIKPLAKKL